MICFLKHFKGIAYFLIMLILFQSCVAYKDTSSTIEQASSDKDMPVKIITKNGEEYKLKWIEEKDGNVVSILNAEIEYIYKNDIAAFVIFEPEQKVVPLELALKNQGNVRVLTKDENNIYNSHEYLRIRENDEKIIGYKMTKNTITVIIPIDQIEMIQLKDKKKSNGRTAGLIVGVGLVVVSFVGAVVAANDFEDHFGL